MKRQMIQINEELCNGCGLCAQACAEGAIGMVGGKARLLRDDYCDGLGNCLPVCPTGAITFIEREADAFDEVAAKARTELKQTVEQMSDHSEAESQLHQWPVQIKLAPVNAPYFQQADLLIAADCTAYAYGNFHQRLIRNRIVLVGCPKLDQCDYSEKLTEILKQNDIKSVTIVRMEVPCCGGMERAVKAALDKSGKILPCQVITISTEGRILE